MGWRISTGEHHLQAKVNLNILGSHSQGAPIAGFLLSAYGGEGAGIDAYRPAIFYAGSTALAASGMVALARLRYSTVLQKKL